MNRSTIANLVVALGFLVGMSSLALAQTGPSGPVGPVVNPTVTPPPATAGLSDQDIEAAIRALDPSFKVRITDDKLGKVYDFTVKRDGWNFVMRITSFPNDIWLETSLGKAMATPVNIPANVLAKLLETNYKVGPTHFAFNASKDGTKVTLFMCRMLDRRITAAMFNGYMDLFLKAVKDTYPVWSPVANAS